ncbi:hypothetical protein G4O51_11370 [Candidatus Bathyarchaeota archaeon A05DMB-2]|jgi:hypothetical protein|nr:hypothetical protein [Candidatus Bathyarchaeota archaeon A05DMB-2]
MRKAFTFGALVTLLFLLCTTSAYAETQIGVKAGDWIRCDYASGGNPPGDAPQWVKVECMSVTGTTATLRIITHHVNGTEQNEIMTWNVASGTGNLTFQAIIQANANAEDTVQIAGYGGLKLAGEKTGTYAGASRTVVYASLSQGEMQFNYCWDKQTGALLEVTLSQGSESFTYKATSTNIWQSSSILPNLPTLNMSIEMLSIVISVAVATAILTTAVIYTKHKRT